MLGTQCFGAALSASLNNFSSIYSVIINRLHALIPSFELRFIDYVVFSLLFFVATAWTQRQGVSIDLYEERGIEK